MGYITFFQFLHRCFHLDAEGYTPSQEILRKTEKRLWESKTSGAARDGPQSRQERPPRHESETNVEKL